MPSFSTTTCQYGGLRHFDVSVEQGCDDITEHPIDECDFSGFTTSTCVTVSDSSTTTTSIPDYSEDFVKIHTANDGFIIGIGLLIAILSALFFAKVWK